MEGAKLHPFLPTILPMDECPKDRVLLVPPVEMVRIVAPDGTVLAENIEYHRCQTVMISGMPAPGRGEEGR